jgi:hypothetical protein
MHRFPCPFQCGSFCGTVSDELRLYGAIDVTDALIPLETARSNLTVKPSLPRLKPFSLIHILNLPRAD